MKKIVLSLAIILFTVASFVSCVNVNNDENVSDVDNFKTISKIETAGVIKIGTTGQQFPFSFKNDKNELDGIDIILGSGLAKRMNVKVEFVELEFDKLFTSLENGDVDLVLSGTSVTVGRNMDVAFTKPYFKTGKSLLTNNKELRKGNKETINIETTKIAVIGASSSEKYVTENYPNAIVIKVKSYDEIIDLFESGDANAFVSDMEICESISLKNLDVDLYIAKLETNSEYISAAVRGDDFMFFNLVSNFVNRVDNNDADFVIDELWLQFLN